MRNIRFAQHEFYHIYGRGNEKKKIFLDLRDHARFLFLILYLQSSVVIYNISSIITNFTKNKNFNLSDKTQNKILDNRLVELVSFTLMPNHFHMIVREVRGGGISRYMQRVLTAYAKYFNAKHKVSGHVFQGPFQAVHIGNDEQLLYTSAYIHKNPKEITQTKKDLKDYKWSSFCDYIGNNRWGNFLVTDVILGQFKKQEDYEKMVFKSSAKEVYTNY